MCGKKIESFKDLYAWQEASKIARNVYKITESFPETEKFGLTTQMRRAAVSVSSNIAESFSRKGKKDKTQLLIIALGSLTELQSQLEFTRDIRLVSGPIYTHINNQTIVAHKLINGLIRTLKA